MTCGDECDCAVTYAFNAAVAKRRLRGTVVVTLLMIIITFTIQYIR